MIRPYTHEQWYSDVEIGGRIKVLFTTNDFIRLHRKIDVGKKVEAIILCARGSL
jgi:hypothetical protein